MMLAWRTLLKQQSPFSSPDRCSDDGNPFRRRHNQFAFEMLVNIVFDSQPLSFRGPDYDVVLLPGHHPIRFLDPVKNQKFSTWAVSYAIRRARDWIVSRGLR